MSSKFKKNILTDFAIIFLSILIALIIYQLNGYRQEKKIVLEVIKKINNEEQFNDIPNSLIDVIWLTNDFEQWTPILYNAKRYNKKVINQSLEPNQPHNDVISITLTDSRIIYTAWVRKNSSFILFKCFIIPFLICILTFFILKFMFLYIIGMILGIETKSEELHEISKENKNDQKKFDLSEDELEGLLH